VAIDDEESGATFIRTPSGLSPIPSVLPADPMCGVMLGEYKVLSRLGAGGMGVVYRGEQPVLGKSVAIKLLQRELAADPSQVKRLLEEARAVCAIRHPNIVDIFSFGQAPDGRQYFVMELLDGISLEDWVREHGQVSAQEAIVLLSQILAALSAAHAAGVVHRDLKPSNIFLAKLGDGTQFVKLLDFGVAKRTSPNASSSSSTNFPIGTPMYMAPEQTFGGEIGPWTDLYALGCLSYELLTGTVPFSGSSIAELISKQVNERPAPLTAHAPHVPDRLEKLVLQLLEKEPAKRPQSANVVRRELERIERSLSLDPTRLTGLLATPAPEPRALVSDLSAPADETVMTLFLSRRNRRWGWVGALVVAAIAVGIGGAVLTSRPTEVSAPLPAPLPAVTVAPPAPALPAAPDAVTEVDVVPPVAPAGARPAPAAPKQSIDTETLRARLKALKLRAQQKLSGGAQRAVLSELDKFAADPDCMKAPGKCWKEVTAFEKDNFP
jgi:serine/threonine-protein kinase